MAFAVLATVALLSDRVVPLTSAPPSTAACKFVDPKRMHVRKSGIAKQFCRGLRVGMMNFFVDFMKLNWEKAAEKSSTWASWAIICCFFVRIYNLGHNLYRTVLLI